MCKILLCMLMILLYSCESKRILYVSEFKVITNEGEAFKKILDKYKPDIDMKKIYKKSIKYCFGIWRNNPVYFCKKDHEVVVMSWYKIQDIKESFNSAHFFKEEKNIYERESLQLHQKISSDIAELYRTQERIRLIYKTDMRALLDRFSD